jgi:hypothetical protein
MEGLELSDTEEAELRRLLRFYHRETGRCRNAKAYLAGCVMAGAELETALLLMVAAYPKEAMATNKLPKQKKTIKPLLDWNLGELLRVAKAASWLPAALEYDKDDWNRKKAKIGDYAELVREIRNLAHPARYMEDHYNKRVTQKHLELVLEIINGVGNWFYSRLAKTVIEHMDEEDKATCGHAP